MDWSESFKIGVALTVVVNAALAAEPKTIFDAPDQNAVKTMLPRVPPTAPAEAAATFRVLDGFRMELLVAEPFVSSPVAMTYDENGRAYVCEMRDYPYTNKAKHKPNQENPTDEPIGRIRLLDDIDGDGVFDKSTIFAEGMSWPTGVACWKGGVFVAATPDIWYLKDHDGDGQADERRKVFTGFRKLNVQAVMNNLVWGLDNHIHGAGGTNGGQIRPGDQPDAKPAVLSRNDFRIDPATGEMELLSGGARFGGSFDDWGNRFLCNIRNPAQHIVLPIRYLARNNYLAARSPIHDMAEAGDQLPVYRISPPEEWREIRAKRWAGERDIAMPRSELVGAGVVTSSSGVTSYRGTAYPEKYRGNVFVCESSANLFYRLQLTPDGVTFKAARVDGPVEMAASTDNWFRPVNFVNAPDGTLHVVDMYRENIEHPWSIPDDIHAAVDLESGRDRGRIWRLTPPEFELAAPPRLGSATVPELVAELANPNAWWRETAQRLLFERQDKTAAPLVRAMLRNTASAQGQVHALWTLHGLGALESQDVLFGLFDRQAEVREHAVRLAEQFKADANLLDALLVRADDPSIRVRFQTALTLGEFPSVTVLDALTTIARRDAADPWVRTAVLSSVAESSDPLLSRLLANREFVANPASGPMLRELAGIVGVRGQTAEMERVLASFHKTDVASGVLVDVMKGIGDGLKRSGKSLRAAPFTGDAAKVVSSLLDRSAETAGDIAQNPAVRVTAISLLGYDEFERHRELLGKLLEPSEPQEVQRAAVAVLSGFTDADVATLLLAHWRTQTPAVREDVVNAMLAVRIRALPLLQAIDNGLLPASQVPFAQRRLLTLNTDPKVKELAAKHFSASAPGPRKAVIEKYKPALELTGDVLRGKAVFEKSCVTCHRLGDLGTKDVGPNLATIRAWHPEQLLINILDPSREVVPAYIGYTLETTEGRVLFGLIVDDGPVSVRMKRPDGTTETIFRRDIESLSGSAASVMPEGIETTVSPDSMADLIAFLRAPVKNEKPTSK